eukprot:s370_g27.t1
MVPTPSQVPTTGLNVSVCVAVCVHYGALQRRKMLQTGQTSDMHGQEVDQLLESYADRSWVAVVWGRIPGPSLCGQFAFSALFASSWSPAQVGRATWGWLRPLLQRERMGKAAGPHNYHLHSAPVDVAGLWWFGEPSCPLELAVLV